MPNVFCLTETCFKEQTQTEIGTVIFGKSKYSSVLSKLNLFGNFIIIIAIFQPSISSLVQFNIELKNLLTKFPNLIVFIFGDFNFDLKNIDNNELNYVTNFFGYS